MKIDDKKLQEKIKFEPHWGQQKVIEAFDSNRETLLRCGRRWGKSFLCSYLAVREALYPDKRIWLVAPNYDLASIVFDTCSRFVGTLLSEKSFKLSKNPRSIIELQHGSIIEVKSAENPVSLLGRSTDLVILDEAARLHKYIWDEYIYPTTHERKGKVIYISTPMGQNWFYDKDIELGDSASFHFTSLDNPYFSKEEYDRAKEGVSERIFRNMYEAEYMSDKESVFSGVDEVIAGTWKGPIPGHHYIIGVDIGRRNDPTVVTVIDRNTNEVVYIDSFKDEFPLQKEKIKKLSVNYNNGKIILESTGVGDPILGDFQRQGVFVEEFRTAGHNKMQLIDKLSLFIQEKAIKIPPHEQLIKELKWFQAVVPEASHTNYVKYCAPRGKSDDHVMSLALAVWDLQTYEGMDENRNNTDISRYRKSHKVFNEYQ